MVMTRRRRRPHAFDQSGLSRLVDSSTRGSAPPPGFDPMTASQEDLARFGFPSRPDSKRQPAEYAFWAQLFSQPLDFEPYRWDILPLFTAESRAWSAQLPRRQTSLNWSGAYITPRDGTVFRTMWGKWQVPTPALPPGGVASERYSSSTWIGFDGQRRYLRSTLPQFGTAQMIDPATGTPRLFAWWQWWVRDDAGQAAPIRLPTLDVHAGDLIMCYMKVKKNRRRVYFAIKNATTGQGMQFCQDAPTLEGLQRIKVSGATAEWVLERPAEPPDPAPLPLANYGTVNFRECGASAINMRTGAKVERSLSAARLIDMYVVKRDPDRTAKISIARPLDDTEFLTRYQ
jgi:hypothetical protein